MVKYLDFLAGGRRRNSAPLAITVKDMAQAEDIMPSKTEPGSIQSGVGINEQQPIEAQICGDRSPKPKSEPRLAMVDVVAGGEIAVTRFSMPANMPRFFRLLLALTGVRIQG
jgi:hypothetical protein